MTSTPPPSEPVPAVPTPPRRTTAAVLGLPLLGILGLAALAVPRVVAHDLVLVPPHSFANWLLAVVPLITWVVVAVLWSRRPLVSLLTAGAFYGVALALVHNLSWGVVFGDRMPRLGGTLEGALSTGVEQVLMRGAMSVSSLMTGVVTGLVTGLIAWGVQALVRTAGGRVPVTR